MKKYLPYILIAVVLIGVFAPSSFASAEGTGLVGKIFGVSSVGEFVRGAAATIGNMVLTAASWIVWAASGLFNYAVAISISNQAIGSSGIVNSGWTITRDFANLFFIFILLYIAIATILQISGYGIKELLVKVIIIALLVNFSLVFTKVIVDSSNIFALEFYNKIAAQPDKRIKKSVDVIPAKDISAAFVSGLKMQTIFNDETDNFGKGGKDLTLMNIVIITLGGSALLLVIAFVLFAAAFMFVIRTVILWILMILAPLAFAAMALPKTKEYATKWWKTLFDQAFFAPAFLFMFYLVAKIIQSDGLKGVVGGGQTGFAGMITNNGQNVNINLIMQFVILIVLMLASLTIAKSMGGAAASKGISMASGAKKWGQGYAGKVSKRYTAPIAKKLAESKGGFARTIRKVPLVTEKLAQHSIADQPEISKYKGQYLKYSPETRASLGKSPFLHRAQRGALEKIKKEEADALKRKDIFEKGTDQEKLAALLDEVNEAKEEAAKATKVAKGASSKPAEPSPAKS